MLMKTHRNVTAIAVLTLGMLASPVSQELGTIQFPTSGAAAAQPAFIRGIKACTASSSRMPPTRSGRRRRSIPDSRWRAGAGHELQSSALGRTGSGGGAQDAGPALTREARVAKCPCRKRKG